MTDSAKSALALKLADKSLHAALKLLFSMTVQGSEGHLEEAHSLTLNQLFGTICHLIYGCIPLIRERIRVKSTSRAILLSLLYKQEHL